MAPRLAPAERSPGALDLGARGARLVARGAGGVALRQVRRRSVESAQREAVGSLGRFGRWVRFGARREVRSPGGAKSLEEIGVISKVKSRGARVFARFFLDLQ